MQLITTTPTLGRFFREIGKPITPGAAPLRPTAEDLRHFARVAAKYQHWLGTPEENAAIGIFYGTTPAKWLIGRRLECAAQMLRTTSLSMTEIALECGFEEPSHFSRTFKTKFGRSPTDYRQQDATRDDTAELSTSR